MIKWDKSSGNEDARNLVVDRGTIKEREKIVNKEERQKWNRYARNRNASKQTETKKINMEERTQKGLFSKQEDSPRLLELGNNMQLKD